MGIAASNADPSKCVHDPFAHCLGQRRCISSMRIRPNVHLTPRRQLRPCGFFTGLYTTEKVTPEGVINYTMTKDIMPLFIENKVAMMMGGGPERG